MKKWFAIYEEDDYPAWAYVLALLTLSLAVKPIEWYFECKERRRLK